MSSLRKGAVPSSFGYAQDTARRLAQISLSVAASLTFLSPLDGNFFKPTLLLRYLTLVLGPRDGV